MLRDAPCSEKRLLLLFPRSAYNSPFDAAGRSSYRAQCSWWPWFRAALRRCCSAPKPALLLGAGDTYNRPDARALLGLGWWYNWGPNGGVPMIWNASQIGREITPDRWLMGFNEPDQAGQADMTPLEGATAWRELEEAYPDRSLVSPGVSRLGWLEEWRQAYIDTYGEPPRVDALGFHCYGAFNAAAAFETCKAQTRNAVALAGRWGVDEVWLTEFAMVPCWNGMDDSIAFLRSMLDWLSTQPKVSRAAWFQTTYRGDESWAFGPDCNTSLVDYDTGELTPLGAAWSDTNNWRG